MSSILSSRATKRTASLEQTLELGWALLSILPRGELDRVSEQELNEHYHERAFSAVASGGTL